MRKTLAIAFATLAVGCPDTNSRRVDAPRPATGCRNLTTSTSLETRVLQDVAGDGCLLLWLRESGRGYDTYLELNIGERVGMGVFAISRWSVRCSEVAAGNYDVAGAQPTNLSGWLTLDAAAGNVITLSASIDAVFGNDPGIPPAQLRIENMNINNREGWVECATGF